MIMVTEYYINEPEVKKIDEIYKKVHLNLSCRTPVFRETLAEKFLCRVNELTVQFVCSIYTKLVLLNSKQSYS
jgi:hypothetical protein